VSQDFAAVHPHVALWLAGVKTDSERWLIVGGEDAHRRPAPQRPAIRGSNAKGAFEQLGVETIGLGAPVLARYGYARCVDDMGLDVARPEPTRQPEAVTAGLESNRDAFDPVSWPSSLPLASD
jgi:hypothetical protein